ncbi:MAG: DNA polymerase III subunit alpha, partial [Planctomycetes bacterium]|nr:DNA polymerase III subunit alpha [Planctomycetota bacterium]
WDGRTVEKIGLLKMDFLGLRNLPILDKAVQNVKKHHGIEIHPNTLPLDDEETFALLQRGETKGIFQLESGGMRQLLMDMKPDCFNDIIATSALYRPGPLEGGMVMDYVNVKNGKQLPAKVHPVVDEILAETYGVMVYQEQVMRILNRVGNIDLSSAYRCIKAISKKKEKIIAGFHEEYMAGAQANGIKESVANQLFELIKKFAGYGFNKSHSTAYGAVSYQTAYLKAHYPQEFMAALLSCGMESSDRISEHVEDARRMGIAVMQPDVNSSEVEFGVFVDQTSEQSRTLRVRSGVTDPGSQNGAITFGLAAVKGVGSAAVAVLVAEREANGPFTSIFDLTERIDVKSLTKGMLEILIKAGALDNLGPHRAQHMLAVERAVQAGASLQRDKARGQKSLFGGEDDAEEMAGSPAAVLPDAPEWTNSQKLAAEKDVFGFYLTSHPIAQHSQRLKRYATHTTRQLADLEEKTEVVLGGMISSIKRTSTKKPSRNGHTRYANFDFEDETGIVRCIIWPEQFARLEQLVKPEQIGFVIGKVDRRGREPNVIIDRLLTMDDAEKEFTQQLEIRFQHNRHTREDMQRVRDTLQRFPGNTDVVITLDSVLPETPKRPYLAVVSTPSRLRVTCGPDLRTALCDLLSAECIRFHPRKTNRNGGANGR